MTSSGAGGPSYSQLSTKQPQEDKDNLSSPACDEKELKGSSEDVDPVLAAVPPGDVVETDHCEENI
jgi:hypothetical protein